jgi:hypothetical protein
MPVDGETLAAYRMFTTGMPDSLWGMPGHSARGLSDTVIVLRQQTGSDAMKQLLQVFESGDLLGLVQVSYETGCRTVVDIHHAVTTLPVPQNGQLARALARAESR